MPLCTSHENGEVCGVLEVCVGGSTAGGRGAKRLRWRRGGRRPVPRGRGRGRGGSLRGLSPGRAAGAPRLRGLGSRLRAVAGGAIAARGGVRLVALNHVGRVRDDFHSLLRRIHNHNGASRTHTFRTSSRARLVWWLGWTPGAGRPHMTPINTRQAGAAPRRVTTTRPAAPGAGYHQTQHTPHAAHQIKHHLPRKDRQHTYVQSTAADTPSVQTCVPTAAENIPELEARIGRKSLAAQLHPSSSAKGDARHAAGWSGDPR